MNLDHQPWVTEATFHTMGSGVTAQRETCGLAQFQDLFLNLVIENSSGSNVTAVGEKTETIPEAMCVCVKYSRAGRKHGIKAVSKLSKSLGSFFKMKICKSHFCGSVLVNPECNQESIALKISPGDSVWELFYQTQ